MISPDFFRPGVSRTTLLRTRCLPEGPRAGKTTLTFQWSIGTLSRYSHFHFPISCPGNLSLACNAFELHYFHQKMADQFKELADVPQKFLRDGTQFMNRCTKRMLGKFTLCNSFSHHFRRIPLQSNGHEDRNILFADLSPLSNSS